jgi:hypothetical protein
MFHLKSLSCLLTVLAAILLTQKSRTGLLIAVVASLIVFSIELRSSQPDTISVNLFSICVYAFGMESRIKTNKHKSIEIKCSDRIEARSQTALR